MLVNSLYKSKPTIWIQYCLRSFHAREKNISAAKSNKKSILKQYLREYHQQTKDEEKEKKIIPDLKTFMKEALKKENKTHANSDLQTSEMNYPTEEDIFKNNLRLVKEKKFFLETYGCQMNENDSEIVTTLLEKNGFLRTTDPNEADVYLTNTCAIRESAEEKVWNNLKHIKFYKRQKKDLVVGILGCMAERMKEKILEKSDIVDIVVGPDAYRDLPNMISVIQDQTSSNAGGSINVQLSLEETYADIIPVRKNALKAFISIMRGCNNMCSFCVVPFTRGRERSRPFSSISDEVKSLQEEGVKEITLLGQNVNSFHDLTTKSKSADFNKLNSLGFNEMYKLRNEDGMRFAELIDSLAKLAPEIRFRFTSPHPKNFPEILLDVIASNNNICKQIHLPAQSGSSELLSRMRRLHTRESYIELVELIRKKIPNVAISSDFIVGFCGETEENFRETLSLIELIKYDLAFTFSYSMRDKTHAYHKLKDDVPEEVKKRRLLEIIDVFKKNQLIKNQMEVGSYQLVLVEGKGKRPNQLMGKADSNKSVVFENKQIPTQFDRTILGQNFSSDKHIEEIKQRDYIVARIDDVSYNTLFATPICKSNINEFFGFSRGSPLIFKEKKII